MDDKNRTRQLAESTFTVEPRPIESDDAARMIRQYVAHLVETVPDGFDLSSDSPPPPGAFDDPSGRFLVLYDTSGHGPAEPIGCGAVWVIEPGIAEIRRMWVVPNYHGRGLGRLLLDALEAAAINLGCNTARLDSMHALESAVAMYRSRGYTEIDDYNGNPNATIWMERRLVTG